MIVSCLCGIGRVSRPSWQVGSPGREPARGRITPFRVADAAGVGLPTGDPSPAQAGGWLGAWLDEFGVQGQAGQVGPAAAGLVPDPVQVRADSPDADVQLADDLSVGAAAGDQGD